MVDNMTTEKRSFVMSRIRSKNTKIDIKMKEILSDITEYTMYPKMEGNPDFIIEKEKIAIFCDGDFWHGYTYKNGKKLPNKYWKEKIERNMARDKKVTRKLRAGGWKVLRFWEHDINLRPEFCIKKIIKYST